MLTEEKLQNFLNDLRIGKYDNERYEITLSLNTINIKDRDTNTKTFIGVYSKSEKWYEDYNIWNNRCKLWKWMFKEPEYDNYPLTYFAFVNSPNDICIISKSLYESFETYRKELIEKDKLVQWSNIESSFGL